VGSHRWISQWGPPIMVPNRWSPGGSLRVGPQKWSPLGSPGRVPRGITQRGTQGCPHGTTKGVPRGWSHKWAHPRGFLKGVSPTAGPPTGFMQTVPQGGSPKGDLNGALQGGSPKWVPQKGENRSPRRRVPQRWFPNGDPRRGWLKGGPP
jgi:hypothetical protein